jgi:DNA-binding HxlR family transcriptional regulator
MGNPSVKDINWNLYGYVVASRYRKTIVGVLFRRPRTPSQLAKECSLPITRVSNTLTELANKEIVACLNPNQRKGRIYKLTEQGKKIAEAIKNNFGSASL